MELNIGDVVCATYGGFDGDKKVGIFVVLYNERYDRKYTNGHTNINCAKITSNNLLGDSYTVRLYKGDANLDNDCIVNISKMHVMSKEQVYKKLGHLNNATMLRVFKEVRQFNNEIEQQILQNMQ